jgi:hypothetical protein
LLAVRRHERIKISTAQPGIGLRLKPVRFTAAEREMKASKAITKRPLILPIPANRNKAAISRILQCASLWDAN